MFSSLTLVHSVTESFGFNFLEQTYLQASSMLLHIDDQLFSQGFCLKSFSMKEGLSLVCKYILLAE